MIYPLKKLLSPPQDPLTVLLGEVLKLEDQSTRLLLLDLSYLQELEPKVEAIDRALKGPVSLQQYAQLQVSPAEQAQKYLDDCKTYNYLFSKTRFIVDLDTSEMTWQYPIKEPVTTQVQTVQVSFNLLTLEWHITYPQYKTKDVLMREELSATSAPIAAPTESPHMIFESQALIVQELSTGEKELVCPNATCLQPTINNRQVLLFHHMSPVVYRPSSPDTITIVCPRPMTLNVTRQYLEPTDTLYQPIMDKFAISPQNQVALRQNDSQALSQLMGLLSTETIATETAQLILELYVSTASCKSPEKQFQAARLGYYQDRLRLLLIVLNILSEKNSLTDTHKQLIDSLAKALPADIQGVAVGIPSATGISLLNCSSGEQIQDWINQTGQPAYTQIALLRQLDLNGVDFKIMAREEKSDPDYWQAQNDPPLTPDLPILLSEQVTRGTHSGHYSYLSAYNVQPYLLGNRKATGYITEPPIGTGGSSVVKHGDFRRKQVILKAIPNANLLTSPHYCTVSGDGQFDIRFNGRAIEKLQQQLQQQDTVPVLLDNLEEFDHPDSLSQQMFGFIVYVNHAGELALIRRSPREGDAIDIDYTSSDPALSPYELGCLTADIMTALNHLILNNIIHFDVKAENIRRSLDRSCFKLLDYGSAGPIGSDSEPTRYYTAGVPHYNTKTGDVISFAIMMMELLNPKLFKEHWMDKLDTMKTWGAGMSSQLANLREFFETHFLPDFTKKAKMDTQFAEQLTPMVKMIGDCFQESEGARPPATAFLDLELVKTSAAYRLTHPPKEARVAELRQDLLSLMTSKPASTDTEDSRQWHYEALSLTRQLIELDPMNLTYITEMKELYQSLSQLDPSEPFQQEIQLKIKILEERYIWATEYNRRLQKKLEQAAKQPQKQGRAAESKPSSKKIVIHTTAL